MGGTARISEKPILEPSYIELILQRDLTWPILLNDDLKYHATY